MTQSSSPPSAHRGLRRRLGLFSHSNDTTTKLDDDETVAVLEATSPPSSHHDPKSASSSPTSSPDRPQGRALSLARKGVTYNRDGSVVCCRFCEILRSGDADFVYEDDAIAVFRPLAPVVASHVLVVPRCHIRNINKLTPEHAELLQRMRAVAELVLLPERERAFGSTVECKFAFHKPPFNSIDHVHMHAFRKSGHAFGCFGAIKYRTETWWCRSFEEVFYRVSTTSTMSSPSSSSSSSPSGYNGKHESSPHADALSIREASSVGDAWRLGDHRPRAIV
jgi:diadenosine tetraphosphate (Ap4A) HIT family hydrolase